MASTEQILEWSYGEVTKPETINYRTLKPERDGLYCERIFGPTKDWECNCGKYKRIKFKDKNKICDKCGVQVTRSKVRRERMGHIRLAAPVSHIWYFKGIPSRMGMLLDISPRTLEKVLYFANFIVLDPGDPNETGLKKHELITDAKYREIEARCGAGSFRAGMGAEAVKEMLMELDLDAISEKLKKEIAELAEKERDRDTEGQKRARAVKRLEVVEAFRLAQRLGFSNINADLIVGLPGDDLTSFQRTLDGVIQLGASNVTVHSLAIKRSARLNSPGGDLSAHSNAQEAAAMVDYSIQRLTQEGFEPYYLYRQTRMAGNLENTGWAKPGSICRYNIYTMDESNTVIACGAGGVSKVKDPYSGRLERIFNFKLPLEYINRFPEILQRKDGVTALYEQFRQRLR